MTQVLFTWGQVGAAIRAAKLGFGLADEQLRRFRQDVARDVTTGFYDVLVAQELVTIAELDLAQKQRHLDEATKRQSAGTATDYDVLAAQVAVENARPDVIRAQNLVRTARLQLAFLLAETGEIDVTGTLEHAARAGSGLPGDVLAKALANRPDLGELKAHARRLQRTRDHCEGGQQAAGGLLGRLGRRVGRPEDDLLARLPVERRRLRVGSAVRRLPDEGAGGAGQERPVQDLARRAEAARRGRPPGAGGARRGARGVGRS